MGVLLQELTFSKCSGLTRQKKNPEHLHSYQELDWAIAADNQTPGNEVTQSMKLRWK